MVIEKMSVSSPKPDPLTVITAPDGPEYEERVMLPPVVMAAAWALGAATLGKTAREEPSNNNIIDRLLRRRLCLIPDPRRPEDAANWGPKRGLVENSSIKENRTHPT